MCRGTLWHSSVKLFSCTTHCEVHCNYWFRLYFASNISYFGLEVCFISTVACKHSDVYCPGYEKVNFYFSLSGYLKYRIILISLFPTLHSFSIPPTFHCVCLSEIFLAVSSRSIVTNKTNTSLSLTTLTASSVLPTRIQLYTSNLQQICAFFIIFLSHMTQRGDSNEFQWVWPKI